jgi:hypothetical protein
MDAFATSRPTSLRRRIGFASDVRSVLLRLADRVRSESAGTSAASPTYSPLAVGILIRAGVSVRNFCRLVRNGADDAELMRYCMEGARN